MDTPRVLELIRPFDPSDIDAEKSYDAVVRRVNRVRGRRAVVARELTELERQFVENDLRFRSGPRRGQSLTRNARRKRLTRLLDLGVERLLPGTLRLSWSPISVDYIGNPMFVDHYVVYAAATKFGRDDISTMTPIRPSVLATTVDVLEAEGTHFSVLAVGRRGTLSPF